MNVYVKQHDRPLEEVLPGACVEVTPSTVFTFVGAGAGEAGKAIDERMSPLGWRATVMHDPERGLIVGDAPSPTTQREAVAFYTALGFAVTPVRKNAKSGYITGWSQPNHRAAAGDFKSDDNVGVINGSGASIGDGWRLYDVDIDANTDAARAVVEALMPPTGWRYGRASKPRSHYSYLVRGEARTRKHTVGGKVAIELRGVTQKGTHTLSVSPGSTHESGETIRFCEPRGAIGRIESAEDFDLHVRIAAAAIAIVTAWPPQGRRHDLRLAFAKVLLGHGLNADCVEDVLRAVMVATDSDEADGAAAVRSTAEAMEAGAPTKGASAIVDALGDERGRAVLDDIARILRGQAADDGKRIVVNMPGPAMVDRAWSAVTAANEPPALFQRGGKIVILPSSANTCLERLYAHQLRLREAGPLQRVPGFREIGTDTFREIVARMVPCVKATRDGVEEGVYPPPEFASLMTSSPALPLPEALGFTPIPFFTADGSLVTAPGLHRATGMFYQPDPGFELPDVPDAPTKADVARALCVVDELVWQFPFAGREGRHPFTDMRADPSSWRRTSAYANMLSFPLTALTRSLFQSVPMFLFDKPASRTGASLLVQCLSYAIQGTWPAESEWPNEESERRKLLTAILITGAPIVFLDDVKNLKSQDLNKILTGKGQRVGRVLGTSEIASPQNLSTFVATGNNPSFPRDMAGRMCRVRLDADMSNPAERGGWDKDLEAWTPANRPRLLGALYTIVRAWFAAGQPQGPHALNGFEAWSRAIGGILANAGIEKFLDNMRDTEGDAVDDDDAAYDDALIVEWVTKHQSNFVTTGEIAKMENVPVVDGKKWDVARLGPWLRVQRNKWRRLPDGREASIERAATGMYRMRVRLPRAS